MRAEEEEKEVREEGEEEEVRGEGEEEDQVIDRTRLRREHRASVATP